MSAGPGKTLDFPDGFWWGTATAGHQVEGGNVHSNWWAWEQQGLVNDGTVSGRACDYWNRFESDHRLMQEFGHDAFRLGVEWARIEPEPGRFDEGALDHYRRMLADLKQRGLRVCLTLNHWVVPEWFAREGSWLSKRALVHWEGFVRRVVPALGEHVDLWVTLNEPMVPVLGGYLGGYHPPCKRNPLAAAEVFRTLLRAHAIAYGVIHDAVPRAPDGSPPLVGFAGAYQYVEPFHESGWLRAPETLLARTVAWLSFRAWDESVRTGRALFPGGVGREVPDLRGSVDWVGVNYYTRFSASLSPGTLSNVKAGKFICPEGIEQTEMGWQVYPPGFRHVIHEVWQRFGKPIWITENGCCDSGDELRRRYLVSHLAQVQRAIGEGCDVRGYFQWTFMDNFEWREGFAKRFGLVAMDHDDPELRRRPRESATMLKQIIEANAITPEIVGKYAPGALDRWS